MQGSQLYVVRNGKRVRVRLGGPIRQAYEQVAERITAAIRAGDLRPGDKLPSENELHEAFGVSRDTVRRGLGLLASQGLLRGEQGRGRFVAEPSTEGQ